MGQREAFSVAGGGLSRCQRRREGSVCRGQGKGREMKDAVRFLRGPPFSSQRSGGFSYRSRVLLHGGVEGWVIDKVPLHLLHCDLRGGAGAGTRREGPPRWETKGWEACCAR